MSIKLLPKTGRLLISEPFLADPNFKRSVILLADHSEEGSLGFVLNQVSNLNFEETIPELVGANFPIYIGGPVGLDSLHYIHGVPEKLMGGKAIGNGLYYGGNPETLRILLENKALDPSEIKFFIGYSGWSEGQLEEELKENAWLVSNKNIYDLFFAKSVAVIWEMALSVLRSEKVHIPIFPIDPSLN